MNVESLNAAMAAGIILYEAQPAEDGRHVSLFDITAARGPTTERTGRWRSGCGRETLEEYVGQEHILGPGKPLRRQIERTSSLR